MRRDFTAEAPGRKMVGDITYIPTWEGWVYLATVIDCHTKAVVGWAVDDKSCRSRARVLGRRRRYAELMRAIQVPVLLLHGEKDRHVPLAAARAAAA